MSTLPTLNGTEVLQIYGSSKLITTAQIAALVSVGGNSGGYSSQSFVTTGTTGVMAILGEYIGWSSGTTGNKTQPIPTSTGSLQQICIQDLGGNATTGNEITAVPATGTIIGNTSVATPYGRIILLDTTVGWVSQ